MYIMVFGSSGKVGKAITKRFCENGFDVIGVQRQDCDLTSGNSIAAVIDQTSPDLVINCSAFNGLEACLNNQPMAYQINTYAPGYMSAVCQKQYIPFIHFSTDYVFSGHREGERIREDDPVMPISLYGATKLYGEDKVLEYNNAALVFRLTSIYGRNFGGPTDAVKQAYLGKGIPADPIMVLHQFCSPTSADLVSKAIYHVVTHINGSWESFHGIYNLSSTGGVWKKDFSEYLLRACGFPNHIVAEGTLTIPRPVYSIFDLTKFCTTFNYSLPSWQDDFAAALPEMRLGRGL